MSLSSTLDGILKQVFATEQIEKLHREKSPMWAFLDKVQKKGNPEVPLRNAHSAGFGGSSARADANAGYSDVERYTLTMSDYFAAVHLQDKDLAGIRGEAALVDLVTDTVDSTIQPAMEQLCYHLVGAGTGHKATCSAVTNGGAGTETYTLSNTYEAMRFQVGQKLVAGDAGSAFALRGVSGGTATLTVSAVDPIANTITVTGNATVADAVAANDRLYVDGDHPSQASGIIKGVKAWIPGSGYAGTDPWFGLTTADNPMFKRGIYSDQSAAASVYDAITNIAGQYAVFSNGHNKKCTMFVHPLQWTKLQKELQTLNHGFQDLPSSETVVGHSGYRFVLDALNITLYTDTFLDPQDCFILDKETCKIYHYNESPITFVDQMDGTKWERTLTTYKAHMASYCQLGISAGNRQLRGILPAV